MRKKIIALIILFAVVIAAVLCFVLIRRTRASRAVNADTTENPIFYTAHRGLSSVAPENTLPALKKAGQAGYYACEFDVYPTKDGVWVLMHDDTIERTTDGKGKISDYTYAELLEFDIKKGKHIPDYPNLKIPTLEQALDVCEQYSMRPMIEVKGGGEEDKKRLWEMLEKRNLTESAIIISFSYSTLELFRGMSESAELWLLVNKIGEDTIEKAEKLNAAVAFNGEQWKNHKKIAQVIDAGLTPAAWTIDNRWLCDRLYDLGVRYITTNRIRPQERTKA